MGSESAADYWRSPDGSSKYSQLLRDHFSASFKDELIDSQVIEINELPVSKVHIFDSSDGFIYGVTEGLSNFILDGGNRTRGVRVEYCWPVATAEWDCRFNKVIAELADRMLGSRSAFRQNQVVAGLSLKKWWPEILAENLLLVTGHQLSRKQYRMESYFPTFIMEIIPVTNQEARVLASDADEFFELCERFSADATQCFRSASFF